MMDALRDRRTGISLEQVASLRVYEAETVLHIARQADDDAWITAAYDRLHEALEEYRTVMAARSA